MLFHGALQCFLECEPGITSTDLHVPFICSSLASVLEKRNLRPKDSAAGLASHSKAEDQVLSFCLSLPGLPTERPISFPVCTPRAALPSPGHEAMSAGILVIMVGEGGAGGGRAIGSLVGGG